MTCQIPVNCQNFSLFRRLQEPLWAFFLFPEKSSFHTDNIESIVWPNHAPRQDICVCFEIHILHWGLCDLLLSSHQNFLPEALLRQCVFPARSPRIFLRQLSVWCAHAKWPWMREVTRRKQHRLWHQGALRDLSRRRLTQWTPWRRSLGVDETSQNGAYGSTRSQINDSNVLSHGWQVSQTRMVACYCFCLLFLLWSYGEFFFLEVGRPWLSARSTSPALTLRRWIQTSWWQLWSFSLKTSVL